MKKIQEPIVGGFFATLVLLLVSYVGSANGLFVDISPLFLLSGHSILLFFFLQLITGWIFAFIYRLFFIKILSWVQNDWTRGLIYGIVISIFLEIGLFMATDNLIIPNLLWDTIGMLIAYGAFGAILGVFIPLSKDKK